MINKKEKKNRGFTLVELVIVIAILAILVGLLAPQYTKYVERTRKSADASNMEQLVKAFEVYAADGTSDLKAGKYTFQIVKAGKNSGTNTTGLVIEVNGTTISSDKDLEDALGTAVPGWKELTTKSRQWSKNIIKADIQVNTEGAITSVTYGPDDFAAYMGSANQ